MGRIANVTAFAEAGVKPTRRNVKVGQLHSESYMRWFWGNVMGHHTPTAAAEEEGAGRRGLKTGHHVTMGDFSGHRGRAVERDTDGGEGLLRSRLPRFRRVRSSGLLDTVGYVGRDKKCDLDTMAFCKAEVVEAVGVCSQ